MIKVLVVDDHPIIRQGIKQMLAETSDMAVIGEAGNGSEALNKIRKQDFDVVLLDLAIPGMSGMDVLKQIKKEKPNLPILVLSRYPEEQYAIPVLKAGASGYISKTSITEELLGALRKVAVGQVYAGPLLADDLVRYIRGDRGKSPRMNLSDREYEILGMIASGKKLSEIAKELCLCQTTVSTYRSRLMKKLNIENDVDLVRFAMENDLI